MAGDDAEKSTEVEPTSQVGLRRALEQASLVESKSHRISTVVAGGLFALFLALLIQALTLFGVITVNFGHLFMVGAWAVGSLMIVTQLLHLKPTRHKVWSVIALGLALLAIDIGYAVRRDSQKTV